MFPLLYFSTYFTVSPELTMSWWSYISCLSTSLSLLDLRSPLTYMELTHLRKYCKYLIVSSGSGITLSEKSSSPARVSKWLELSRAYPELWKTLSLFSFSHPLLAQSLPLASVAPSPPWVSHFPSWPRPYPELVLSSQYFLCISLSLLPDLTLSLWSSLSCLISHCLAWSWAYPAF